MSLFDGLILDSLLDTVMKQDVWFANRTDSASTSGAGTELNPYEAAGTATDSDPPFDQRMRQLAALNQPVPVRLLPGTYYSRGFNTGQTNTGWKPFTGLRILGSSNFEYRRSKRSSLFQ